MPKKSELNLYIFHRIRKKILEGFLWSFNESQPYFKSYGLAVLIGVLSFYFFNNNFSDHYEALSLRIIAIILAIPLIFNSYWPQSYKKYLILYWFLVFTYTLPFFFSYMMLMNQESYIWYVNGIICLIIMILFLDIITFFVVLLLGIFCGYIFYYLISPEYNGISFELRNVLYSYIGPLIYILLFSRKKEKVQRQKIENMQFVAQSIAHELRTPLAAMTMGSQALAKLLPTYLDAYAKAQKAQLLKMPLTRFQEQNIEDLPRILETVSQNANTMISLLLTNLSNNYNSDLELCSMELSIKEALNSYPFSSHEKDIIKVIKKEDFNFLGHSELAKHILFNLIKNSLYAIAAHNTGEITITLIKNYNKKFNKLVFKDTGTGIAPHHIPYIFDRFYSHKDHGTGVGLAFCRDTMEQWGGYILCSSDLGLHTTFELYFPQTLRFK
jgi:signal transduction histidine kinase